MAAPTLLLDDLAVGVDATVTARGRWSGGHDGRQEISAACAARYRLVEGRIVEIWSTRRNYAFLCGAHLEHRWGFVVELLRARRWMLRTPQLDLTADARVQPITFRSPAMPGVLLAPVE